MRIIKNGGIDDAIINGSINTSSVFNGVLVGTIDGVNTTFNTSYNFIANSVRVHQNGQRLRAGNDYTESGTIGIIFVSAPQTGDLLLVDYITTV